MARPNYGYQKYQKEMKRKKKQEEKRLRRLEKANTQKNETPAGQAPEPTTPGQNPPEEKTE